MRERGDRPFRFVYGLLKAAHLHGHFRVKIGPPFRKLERERRNTTLQTLPLHFGGPFSVGTVSIGPVQYQHVFIRSHQIIPLFCFRLLCCRGFLPALNTCGFLLYWLPRMQPTGNHARIGSTIRQAETVAVSGLAGEGDYRQWLSAGSFPLSLADKQQVSRLPPRLNSTTCSPTDGFHQVRGLPARIVSQLIQLVSRSPVFTRHSQLSRSTSVTVPVRNRLVIRRMISVSCAFMTK